MDDAVMSAVIARRDSLRAEFSVKISKETWADIRACDRLISKLKPSSSLQFQTETLADPWLGLQKKIASLGLWAAELPDPTTALN